MYQYTCEQCKAIYKAPQLSYMLYGEFLMRSINGNMIYLNALSDFVFNEVHHLLRELFFKENLSDSKYSDLLHDVFGVACDSDSDGNEYSINNNPNCPECGCNKSSFWEELDPPEFIDLPIPTVTHNNWIKLTKTEKLHILNEAIGR